MKTRRQFLFAGLCVGAGVSLVSCGPPSEGPSYPDLRFTSEPPLLLKAADIEIRTFYRPTQAENVFPVTPLRAMQNWARDRLRATGQGGPARFTIANASAIVRKLPVKGGVSGFFTDQLSQEYDVTVDAALELFDAQGAPLRSVRVTATRSRSVLQSASADDRARARYELVRHLMDDFDRQAQSRIAATFGPYLVSA